MVLENIIWLELYIKGLVQDCSNFSALAMELLQSCTQPPIWFFNIDQVRLIDIIALAGQKLDYLINNANIMAAVGLVPQGTRPSAAMVLTISDG